MVCGCIDPFAKVQGRGIERMREAGIDVTVGVLEDECIESNIRFMTFNKPEKAVYNLEMVSDSKRTH